MHGRGGGEGGEKEGLDGYTGGGRICVCNLYRGYNKDRMQHLFVLIRKLASVLVERLAPLWVEQRPGLESHQ